MGNQQFKSEVALEYMKTLEPIPNISNPGEKAYNDGSSSIPQNPSVCTAMSRFLHSLQKHASHSFLPLHFALSQRSSHPLQ